MTTTSTREESGSQISQVAKELQQRLNEEGALAKEAVKEWIISKGVPAKDWGLVLAQGSKNNQNRWYSDELWVYPGPRPPEVFNINGESFEDENPSMESSHDQFLRMAVNLGVAQLTAKAAAYYCFENFDMTNPADAWQAIYNTKIHHADKRKVWQTWMSSIDVQPPPELDHLSQRGLPLTYLQQPQHTTNGASSANGQDGARPTKRYIATEGEIKDLGEEDPYGLTYAQALRQAELQIKHMQAQSGPDQDTDLAAAAIRESGETTRSILQQLKQGGDDKGVYTVLAAVIESSNQSAQRQQEMMIELMKLNAGSKGDEVSEGLKMLAATLREQQGNKGPLSDLDSVLTLLERVKNTFAPQQASNSNNLNIPTAIGDMNLDQYERIKGIESRETMYQFAREQFPVLMDTVKGLASGLHRYIDFESGNLQKEMPDPLVDLDGMARQQAEQQAQQQAPPVEPPPPGHVRQACVKCHAGIERPAGLAIFGCPACRQYQTAEGEALTEEQAAERIAAQMEQEEPAPAQEESASEEPSGPEQPTASPEPAPEAPPEDPPAAAVSKPRPAAARAARRQRAAQDQPQGATETDKTEQEEA